MKPPDVKTRVEILIADLITPAPVLILLAVWDHFTEISKPSAAV
jgi:hypothetical protein